MITLYQYDISPFCDKIRRVLNYKKLPYQLREVTLTESVTGAYKKINPIGKVPTLDHDGKLIADSTHIARYIEERFPQPALIPIDKKLAALSNILEDWADESLYFYELRLRLTEPHNAQRWIPELVKNEPVYFKLVAPKIIPVLMSRTAKAQGVGLKPMELLKSELNDHMKSIAQWLADGQWLVGESLSLADIAVFVQLRCLEGTVEGTAALADFAEVRAWMKRVDLATNTRSA